MGDETQFEGLTFSRYCPDSTYGLNRSIKKCFQTPSTASGIQSATWPAQLAVSLICVLSAPLAENSRLCTIEIAEPASPNGPSIRNSFPRQAVITVACNAPLPESSKIS